ncbi:MAG: glycoside hydrolase family 36 protein [Bryobacteraceae bacterium]
MKTRLFAILLPCLFLSAAAACADFQFSYDQSGQLWTLNNGVIQATFQLNQSGQFTFQQLVNLSDGAIWNAPSTRPSSPIRFTLNSTTYDATTQFTLVDQNAACSTDGKSCRQTISLQDAQNTVLIHIYLEMYANQPVIRHSLDIVNLTASLVNVRMLDLLPYAFDDNGGATFRNFRVDQWAVVPRPLDFGTLQATLNPNGTPIDSGAGAHGQYCSWTAVADTNNHGLFGGWEFDGSSTGSVKQNRSDHTVQIDAVISSIYHPVPAGTDFAAPWAFLGMYDGDWDEAGYRTQRFVEAVIAKPIPDPTIYPYLNWDSWGYQAAVDEIALRQEADLAAQLGVDVFVIDLGWAAQLGNWYADPNKFPSGMRAFSDYVHSLGMKFGLHFAFAEADPASPVLQQNPDWTSTDSYNYYGAMSLCLSNQPAQDWIVQQALHIIDDYNVDWMLQDGEDMVKHCTKTTHTHDPRDSNYSNAVDGVNAVVRRVQALRPNVLWENCEDGGNMMTFNMVKYYVTSITNDASGALGSRQGVYGATYPFPPRYTERYEPEPPASSYDTRSYMFGGPWYLMFPLMSLDDPTTQFLASEIQAYKNIRTSIRDSKVFHLTPPPAVNRIDALESYNPATDTDISVVTRDGGTSDHLALRLRGLLPQNTYQITFQSDARVLTMSGADVAAAGILVNLPGNQCAEIVYAAPLQ